MKRTLPNLNKALFFFGVFLLSVKLFAVTHIIVVSDNAYTPSSLTIPEGDDVAFELAVGAVGSHPTIADNGTDWTGAFPMSGGGIQTSVILSVGSHGYHCQNHGSAGAGMHGTITVTSATGTKSAKSSYGLTISPNPIVDEVNFSFDQNHSELTYIKIVDLIGNEIAEINLANNSSSGYRFDFSHLHPGVYFCNLYSDKGIIETRKLFRTK